MLQQAAEGFLQAGQVLVHQQLLAFGIGQHRRGAAAVGVDAAAKRRLARHDLVGQLASNVRAEQARLADARIQVGIGFAPGQAAVGHPGDIGTGEQGTQLADVGLQAGQLATRCSGWRPARAPRTSSRCSVASSLAPNRCSSQARCSTFRCLRKRVASCWRSRPFVPGVLSRTARSNSVTLRLVPGFSFRPNR
ncbi:hypothetical protein [Massilia sp. Se16.2.3]|uniref:hypothetical protein n=1 Tax=Massilia sp. Se16.2.3 TaxID=2709303 RepID=UPI001602439A|nr:hypothetical protein [Massilia sp. Se16.2.3]QNA97567.1 hypothetical protein G4G31_17165 [Massilia sp. Se16.2.3]